jgi:hypothetical protein
MKPRQFMLALALVATVVAAFWPRPEKKAGVAGTAVPDVVGAMAKSQRKPAAVPRAQGAPEDRRLGAMRGNLFPAQTWRPPPPPPPKQVPLPPPPPVAPPLPFQYLGRWKEGGKDVIFLVQGNRVLKAQVGDALSGWHLDQATDDALTFTWTQLNMQQTLRIAP